MVRLCNTFFLFLLPCLSVIKVFVQSKTAKDKIANAKDCLLFTGLVSAVSAAFLAALFLRSLPTATELIFAAIYALCSVGFQFFYVLAFKNGPLSVTSTVTSFAVVIRIVFGTVYYHTKIGVFGYVSFALIALAFLLIPDRKKGKGKKANASWIVFTLLAFLFSGANSAAQVVVSKTEGCNVNTVVVISYLFSAALCLSATLLFLRQKITLRPEKSLLFGIPIIAISLGLYNLLSVITLKDVPETVFYTVVPGIHLALVNVVGIVFMKEKKTALQIVGMILAVLAVILIHF